MANLSSDISNIKKVRGLKRNAAQIERLREANLKLDSAALDRHSYTYVKMWIAPWYNLEKRNPPLWYRRRVLQAMIDIHNSWLLQLQQRGEPFYLKIWFHHPRFYYTQVVAAVGERRQQYESLFSPEVQASRGALRLYDTPTHPVSQLPWEPHIDEEICDDEDWQESPQQIAWLEQNAYAIDEYPGRRLFRLRMGTVWLSSGGDGQPFRRG